MSNVNPIFDRLFDSFAAQGLLPKRQDEQAIATDIPRPADPLPWLDDEESGDDARGG